MSLRLPAQTIQRILQREKGQTIVEYALILVLFSIAMIAAQLFFQGGLQDYYQKLSETIAGVI